jgi:hypothetical protein
MEDIIQELERSEALRRFLEVRAPSTGDVGCLLSCKWIKDDLKSNGKLTGWPLDSLGTGLYPREGKIRHLYLELVGGVPDHKDFIELVPKILEALKTR